MIYVINKTPEVKVFIQKPVDNSAKRLQVRSGYTDVSIGESFNCVIDLTNGSRIDTINATITSITLEMQTVKRLPKNRGGEITLEMSEYDYNTLSAIIDTKKVQLCRHEDIDSNVYMTNVISLDSNEKNDYVKKLSTHLPAQLVSEDCLLYVARAFYEDVPIGEVVNSAWDFESCELFQPHSLEIVSVFYNSLRQRDILVKGVTCLIVLRKRDYSKLLIGDSNSMLSRIDSPKRVLMIGKRIVLAN